MTQELTILAKNLSSCIGEGWDDLELCQGASRSDGRSAQTREVVAIRACNTLDQAKGSQAMQLTRQTRGGDPGQIGREICTAYAMDVEFRALQGPQQSLLGTLEEVQALDRPIALALRLGEPGEFTLAAGGILDSGEELQVASIASGDDLAQIDQA